MVGQHNLIGGEIMPYKPLPRPTVVQPSDPSIRHIPLTRGYVAIVDASDYEFLSLRRWFAHKESGSDAIAAYTHDYIDGKQNTLLMHRVIMNAPRGVMVDHWNRNSLDNRRRNLRLATNRQNMANCAPHKDNKTGFKGVYKNGQKWVAQIASRIIGTFNTAENAATAYNLAALELYGEFARLNIATEQP